VEAPFFHLKNWLLLHKCNKSAKSINWQIFFMLSIVHSKRSATAAFFSKTKRKLNISLVIRYYFLLFSVKYSCFSYAMLD